MPMMVAMTVLWWFMLVVGYGYAVAVVVCGIGLRGWFVLIVVVYCIEYII